MAVTPPVEKKRFPHALAAGVVAGFLYGVFARFAADARQMEDWFGVMTLAFVSLVPLAL